MMEMNERRPASVRLPQLLECSPGRGWTLIRPDERTNLTNGKLILAGGDETETTLRTGLVVAIGGGIKMDSGDYTDETCQVGDSVLFTDAGSALVSLNGAQHVLVRNMAVLGKAKQSPYIFTEILTQDEVAALLPEPANGAPGPIR